MIKQKLKDKRVERDNPKDDFAFKLWVDTFNCNRRESGVTEILIKEWDKMAEILDTALNKIYEPVDNIYAINGDNAHGYLASTHALNNNYHFNFDL